MTTVSGARHVLAAALLASTTLTAVPALAQANSPSAIPQLAQAQLAQGSATRSYSIPAGPLGSALTAFGEASGLRLLVGSDLLAGRTSTAVSGRLSAEQALQRLLTGTGLVYRFTEGNTVTVVEAPRSGDAAMLPPVAVQGDAPPVPPTAMIGNLMPAYSGGQVARGGQLGMLGNRDIMDTPFNQTSYTAQLIQDQQARTLSDVMENDPSVRVIGTRGTYDNQFMIRGFSVNNDDIAYGGLYGILPRMITSAELAERVEVLKGPSALTNGMDPSGSVGGTINIVPKRAQDTPITQLTLNYMSDAQFGTHMDVGRRAGERNQYGVRFNGSYRNGDVAAHDQEQQFGMGVLNLDFRGERVRLSVDGGYQEQDVQKHMGFIYASGTRIPDAPDTSDSFRPSWAFAETRDRFGIARAEVDLTDSLTAYLTVGGRQSSNTTWGPPTTVNNTGVIAAGNASYISSDFNTLAAETGFRSNFETGDLRHEVSLIANATKMENGFRSYTRAVPASSLYSPSTIPEPSRAGFSNDAPKLGERHLQSLGLADTLSVMEDRLQVTLGARQQRVALTNYNTTTQVQTTSFNENKLSPAAAVVYKPWEKVSLYANYIEGLTPGDAAPTTGVGIPVNAGQYLAPYKTEQYEAGVKMDHGSFVTTVSVFQISKPFGIDSNGTATGGVFEIGGEQRNRGVEFNTFGSLTDDIRVLGGAVLIDGEQTKTAAGLNDGKRPFGVPTVQANIGAEYDAWFDKNLTLTGRVVYTSTQYYNATNTLSIPEWTRVDIGARYRLETRGVPVTIRAGIENLFDKNYWASTGSSFSYLGLGAPRTFLVSTTFDF